MQNRSAVTILFAAHAPQHKETARQRHNSLFGRLSVHHPSLLTGMELAERHDIDDDNEYSR